MLKIRRSFLRAGHAVTAGALVAFLSTGTAQASFIATIQQQGSDVVASGSGTLDLTGLSGISTSLQSSGLSPAGGEFFVGPAPAINEVLVSVYGGVTGPASFGSGAVTNASTGSGDLVGIRAGLGHILVPSGYVSGSALLGSATFDNTTLANLGLTAGTYTWLLTGFLGNPNPDSFVLKVLGATNDGSSVPEPPTLALFGAALAGLGVIRRRRKAA